MSSPVSSAAMPPEALHSAMTTPMISVVVAPPDERPVADLMAPLKIPAAGGGELLPGAFDRVLPAGPAQLERRLRAALHLTLRRYRLLAFGACLDRTVLARIRRRHFFLHRQMATEPATKTPTATASGQRRCTTGLRRTCPDRSAALAWALAFTSALAASSSTVSPRRSRVRSISCWICSWLGPLIGVSSPW